MSTARAEPATGGGAQQGYDHMFKIVMIGDTGVGKSSLLLRFTDDKFEEDQLSTIGVDLRVKFLDLGTGAKKKRVKGVIWDTAGQERFRTLTASYYHKVQGVILVYDVTRRETFDSLSMWNREIDVNTDGAPVVKILVGNKVDEAEKRQVARKEGEMFSHEHGMLFVESSAKTRVGVQQVFQECMLKILDNEILVKNAVSGSGTVLSAAQGDDKNAQNDENSLSCCS